MQTVGDNSQSYPDIVDIALAIPFLYNLLLTQALQSTPLWLNHTGYFWCVR